MTAQRSRHIDELLDLAKVDAPLAASRAKRMLDDVASIPSDAAKLRWVIGLAERDSGQLHAARETLELACSLARDGADEALGARISSSLAHVLGQLGALDEADEMLSAAAGHLDGADRASAVGQRGLIAYWRGDLDVAATDLRVACEGFAIVRDIEMESRARSNLGAVLSVMGDLQGAELELRRAAELAEMLAMSGEAGLARVNLGFVATLRGDLPTAMSEFAHGEALFRAADSDALLPRLHADHAQALADAGLFADAETLVRQAIEMYREQGQETELAGVLLTSAAIRLAASDAAGAVTAAQEAEARFRSQDRVRWAGVAQGLALQAAARLDAPPVDLAEQLIASAELLRSQEWGAEATRAELVAVKLRALQGRLQCVSAELRTSVEHGRVADQILLAHVDALAATDPSTARDAVERGLRLAAATQAGLGSIETRAHAAVHGYELGELGARLAIGDGRPRDLLTSIEATRIMSSRLPSVRPPADAEMASLLVDLRSIEAKLADRSDDLDERTGLEAQSLALERQIRRRSRTLRGDGTVVDLDAEIGAAIALLGERQLLAHAKLDGGIHAVSVTDGRVELHSLGAVDDVRDALGRVAFALHRLNRLGGSEASRASAAELAFMAADRLAELLVPPALADSDRPLVVVPTALIHDVPWGLLPPLAGRAVAVNSSVTGWARAQHRRIAGGGLGRGAVGLVAGPDLEFAGTEVEALATRYPAAVSVVGDEATGKRCLELLATCDLVHLACHGRFRADNPLFSAVVLSDGPLNVYDFEQLDQLPDTVVLSACSVAGATAVAGDAVLGLATALTTLGVSTVIAPLTPISDVASVTAMQRLHDSIAAGVEPAQALAYATMAHDLADPTAAAFISLGA